jgi:hypothetical protein
MKWEVITINFIIGLPRVVKQHDSILVVVYNLTNEASFIYIKSTHKFVDIAKIFARDIFILHRVPNEIVFDNDTKFASNFWKNLFEYLCVELNFVFLTIHRYMGTLKESIK